MGVSNDAELFGCGASRGFTACTCTCRTSHVKTDLGAGRHGHGLEHCLCAKSFACELDLTWTPTQDAMCQSSPENNCLASLAS